LGTSSKEERGENAVCIFFSGRERACSSLASLEKGKGEGRDVMRNVQLVGGKALRVQVKEGRSICWGGMRKGGPSQRVAERGTMHDDQKGTDLFTDKKGKRKLTRTNGTLPKGISIDSSE